MVLHLCYDVRSYPSLPYHLRFAKSSLKIYKWKITGCVVFLKPFKARNLGQIISLCIADSHVPVTKLFQCFHIAVVCITMISSSSCFQASHLPDSAFYYHPTTNINGKLCTIYWSSGCPDLPPLVCLHFHIKTLHRMKTIYAMLPRKCCFNMAI